MPLDPAKLKFVRRIGDRIRAQCPACAADGHDTKGQHLSIDAEGRFGCAVHKGDHPHRCRIAALAGDGSKIPASSIKCRPVALRQKWKSPDGADGCKPTPPPQITSQSHASYGKMPSESSEKWDQEERLTGPTRQDPSEPSEKPRHEGFTAP
jgi:hypothetical protein